MKNELKFLDDAEIDPPQGLPLTSLWVATAWQRDIAKQELPKLATVIVGEPGHPADSSPSGTGPGQTRCWHPVLTSTLAPVVPVGLLMLLITLARAFNRARPAKR